MLSQTSGATVECTGRDVKDRIKKTRRRVPYKLAYKTRPPYKPPRHIIPLLAKGCCPDIFWNINPLKYIILTKIKLFLNRNYTISTTIVSSISTTSSSSSIGITDASFSTSSGVKLLCNSSESPLSLGRQS